MISATYLPEDDALGDVSGRDDGEDDSNHHGRDELGVIAVVGVAGARRHVAVFARHRRCARRRSTASRRGGTPHGDGVGRHGEGQGSEPEVKGCR